MSMEYPERFFVAGNTASAGTAFAAYVPPHRGAGGAAMMQKVVGGRPNWAGGLYTHVESAVYVAGSTAHDLVFMRPMNYAVVNGDVAANGTVVNVLTDPGAYSTAFKFQLPPEAAGLEATAADNGIAANDYVLVQLRDGTWHMSTVASVSSLAVTLNTAVPNVTGGGVEDGSILWFFGVASDTNPRTGRAHTAVITTASARTEIVGAKHGISVPSLGAGEPFILYSANASNQGWLASVAGRYDRP
jgi:hypothetical protein